MILRVINVCHVWRYQILKRCHCELSGKVCWCVGGTECMAVVWHQAGPGYTADSGGRMTGQGSLWCDTSSALVLAQQLVRGSCILCYTASEYDLFFTRGHTSDMYVLSVIFVIFVISLSVYCDCEVISEDAAFCVLLPWSWGCGNLGQHSRGHLLTFSDTPMS